MAAANLTGVCFHCKLIEEKLRRDESYTEFDRTTRENDVSMVEELERMSQDAAYYTHNYAAVSVPKKERDNEPNKKEAVGDLDAFRQEQEAKASEPSSTQADPVSATPAAPPTEVVDETWQDAPPTEAVDETWQDAPPTEAVDEIWQDAPPTEAVDEIWDDALPTEAVDETWQDAPPTEAVDETWQDAPPTEAVDETWQDAPPTEAVDETWQDAPPTEAVDEIWDDALPTEAVDETREVALPTALAELQHTGIKGRAEEAWTPSVKKPVSRREGEDPEEDDSDHGQTQELLKRMRSILNKMTPQMFQQLMEQVMELNIDTEERLKGVVELIFEKAISEPIYSGAYANVCCFFIRLKVPMTDKPGHTVKFRNLLLNLCQKEFEKHQESFEKEQKELDATKDEEERERLKVELEESREEARRRSLGNIELICELFKLTILSQATMLNCVVHLLRNQSEESLECLCKLLSTIGKDLDLVFVEPRMDQYYILMDMIIKERTTSSRIRFMLQDVLDLRRCNWMPKTAS